MIPYIFDVTALEQIASVTRETHAMVQLNNTINTYKTDIKSM